MRSNLSLTVLAAVLLLFVASTASAEIPPLMNYQGYLTDESGEPLDTAISMIFTIYDDPDVGTPWWTETIDSVVVVNGLFNVTLGYDSELSDTVFSGAWRWLGITVGSDPEIYPRTELVAVPWAFRVATVDGARGGMIDGGMEVLGNLDAGGLTIGGVPVGTSSDSYWSQSGDDIFYNLGNVGIGTITPAEALDVQGNLHASGALISGSSITIDGTTDQITATSGRIDFDDENIVTTGKASIGPGHTNSGDYAFVAGSDNEASGDRAAVGGGNLNTASGARSVIGGGVGNVASGWTSTVAGGSDNSASAWDATVGGGAQNDASDTSATVSGGKFNTAAKRATVSGGEFNEASEEYTTVSGGSHNVASAYMSTVCGGEGNKARGQWSVVCGGGGSDADSNAALGIYSSVGGGAFNIASGVSSVLGGGYDNSATGGGAAVAGGHYNRASGDNSTVSGGSGNRARGHFSVVAGGGGSLMADSNAAIGDNSVVGGGQANVASGVASTVAGGLCNTSSGLGATVGGGGGNTASVSDATVAGGQGNTASGGSAVVGGGANNTATGDNSTIAGGSYNLVEGFQSAILGGFADTIGASADYSYLFGIRSRLDEDSTFMVDMPHIVFEGDIIQTRPEGDTTAALSYFDGGGGFIGTFGPNGTLNAALTVLSGGNEDHGGLGVANADGDWRVKAYSDPYYTGDRGVIETYGPNGNINITLWNAFVDQNGGCVSVADAAGEYRGHFLVTDDSAGVLQLLGPNGSRNVSLLFFYGDRNNGWLGVFDSSGDAQAGIYVDLAGDGIVWGDFVGFKAENAKQPGTDIWYCALEGPEAAAYVRGTGHLVNGRADVSLPDHFTSIASSQGITVQVTPLSGESKGLAVVEKNTERFAVHELNNGSGTYDFDFMVTAVRKGHEDYQVIRASMEPRAVDRGATRDDSPVQLLKSPGRR